MIPDSTIAVFSLDGQRYALRFAAMDCALRAVEVTALPGAPRLVDGAIDVRGSLIPVYSLRKKFRMQERAIVPTDVILLARSHGRRVALVVDSLAGLQEVAASAWEAPEALGLELQGISGIVRHRDGIILIHDLDAFLSAGEEAQLSSVLNDLGCGQ